ncbi:MAG: Mpo1-like protein [Thermoanaerobaculia bacterium]
MNLEVRFADYAIHHADPWNKACHYVGLPLIALCLFGLGSKLRLAEVAGGTVLDLGLLLALALVGIYLRWRPGLAIGVGIVFAPLYLLGSRLPFPALVTLLAVGVTLQYLGHYVFEKRSPAFHHNLVHTLVGPLWIAQSFFRLLGLAPGKQRR